MGKKKLSTRRQRRALFEAMLEELRGERDELRKRLVDVEGELTEYGLDRAKPRRAPPRRRARKATGKQPREGSLKDLILKVLRPGGMHTRDIARAAIGAGYKTKSKNLEQSVWIACSELSKNNQISRVGRGMYAPVGEGATVRMEKKKTKKKRTKKTRTAKTGTRAKARKKGKKRGKKKKT